MLVPHLPATWLGKIVEQTAGISGGHKGANRCGFSHFRVKTQIACGETV